MKKQPLTDEQLMDLSKRRIIELLFKLNMINYEALQVEFETKVKGQG